MGARGTASEKVEAASGAVAGRAMPKGPYVKIAVAACLIMSAMIAGTVSFGFFMEPVTTQLGFDRATFSLYFSLMTIVGTLTLPFYGRLIERFGTRPFVVIGGIWTGLAMAALSLCHTLPAFYGVGCLVGLGFFGCSYAVVPVIVADWFVEKNGFIMGLAAACGGVVAMALSFVFPSFIIAYGWEAGYVLLGCVVFVLTTPVGVLLLRSKPADVGLVAYGAPQGAPRDAAHGIQDSKLSSDGGESGDGVSYRDALRSPQLWVTAAGFLLLAVTVMVTQHLAAYFVSIGFDAVTAGVFMSVISAGIIVTNIVAGALSDRIGLVQAFVVCSVLYSVSFLLLPATGVVAVVCVALVLMSLGNANTTLFAPMMTRGIFGMKDYASIWGIVSMASVLGQAIGAPLWGLSFDLTASYVPAMVASAVLIAVSAFALAWVYRRVSRVRPIA